MVFAFAPPAITELGNATGFNFQLLDRNGLGHAALMAARGQLLGLAQQNEVLANVRPNGQSDEAKFQLLIDWERASALGLSVSDINGTLSAAWGATYVNDFMDRGRIKRVYMQGIAPWPMLRSSPQRLLSNYCGGRWFVRVVRRKHRAAPHHLCHRRHVDAEAGAPQR